MNRENPLRLSACDPGFCVRAAVVFCRRFTVRFCFVADGNRLLGLVS
jgi:hypothetical protein